MASFSMLLLLALSKGCENPLMLKMAPHADGVWIGRVVAIQVQTHEGAVHDAAALEVESGPELPFSVPPEFGAGKKPLLVRDGDTVSVIVDPGELPLGQRVRINGSSFADLAFLPRVPRDGLQQVHRPYEYPQGQLTKPEHILILRGKPKVLE